MPTYEFVCLNCGQISGFLVRNIAQSMDVECRNCQSRNLRRSVSAFAYHRSERTVLEQYGAEPKTIEDFKDPRQIGRRVERRFGEMGLEVPAEAKRMIEEAREGHLPGAIGDV